jgi:hypothetical protein
MPGITGVEVGGILSKVFCISLNFMPYLIFLKNPPSLKVVMYLLALYKKDAEI